MRRTDRTLPSTPTSCAPWPFPPPAWGPARRRAPRREYAAKAGARTTKSSETDLATEADRATERVVRDALLDARPGDGFLGEESVSEWTDDPRGDADDRVVWVVDPIDGTTNYVYGQPDWGISVAATRGGRSLVGVVITPRLDLEYVATLGGGATRNGERLGVAESPPLRQAPGATRKPLGSPPRPAMVSGAPQ